MIDGAALTMGGGLTRFAEQSLPVPAKSGDFLPPSCARRVDLSSSRCCFEFCKALTQGSVKVRSQAQVHRLLSQE
ncbi:MAG: hypothetical protein AVDCRST_MAG93-2087 [uncultured Chloroflexia bacterium]|uniref:Uncharacterized protein n=1 Tax=uncultured Chloroflexia bacterium TaxID=1672391 RepID=A0A6J4ITC4_9CHLR|nr:MAG: hypothetical protein AVDCRST_MAG93-2087 [uncultured Chloroflexia bacterium]